VQPQNSLLQLIRMMKSSLVVVGLKIGVRGGSATVFSMYSNFPDYETDAALNSGSEDSATAAILNSGSEDSATDAILDSGEDGRTIIP
jgi:hypothetical protein